jgi:hypothetical protein
MQDILSKNRFIDATDHDRNVQNTMEWNEGQLCSSIKAIQLFSNPNEFFFFETSIFDPSRRTVANPLERSQILYLSGMALRQLAFLLQLAPDPRSIKTLS